MLIELDRKDIINLVKGCVPHHSVMYEIPSELGYYNGSYGRWEWRFDEKTKYSDAYLYELYLKCKNSWN